MLFVHKADAASHIIKDRRGFDDVELPLSVANEEALRTFFEDYNAIQEYLSKVYTFGKQRAFKAIEQLEVPECLRTIAEAPEAAHDVVPPRRRGIAARSSTKSQPQPTQPESNTPTKT